MMMFDDNGQRIRPSDIQKCNNIHQRSPMNRHSNGLCNGLCKKYKARKPLMKSRYAAGQVRCQICEIYLNPDGLSNEKESPTCRCCNYRVRTKPRNRVYKEKYREENVRNVNEPWINSEDESTQDSEFSDEKISAPVIKELDSEYEKSFYELKNFIENEIKTQANYQLVMLKFLVSRKVAYQSEIAEMLAYFNNKDSSDMEQVKKFFYVPVYEVLLKHKFVKVLEGYSGENKYFLNVMLNEYQQIEIDNILEKKISEWNDTHGIPENEFEKTKEIQKATLKINEPSKRWIWSVTPENWEILKIKNVWGSRIPKEKISNKIKPGDHVAFYVIGTKSFKGIFEFVGKWYDSPGKTWNDDTESDGTLRYKSQIKIIPICIGSVKVSDLYEKIELFKGKPQNVQNLILQGGSGYPSNNNRPIIEADFLTIFGKMKNGSTKKIESKISNNEDLANQILKECPKCNLKIQSPLSEDELVEKIQELFGFRQMDPLNSDSIRPQSHCRKCRNEK